MLQMWFGVSLDRRCSETGKFRKESSLEQGKDETCAYKLTKIDKTSEKVQNETSHRKYMRLWHVCLPM